FAVKEYSLDFGAVGKVAKEYEKNVNFLALQINNTPEYIISSPQLFLSIKHISPPGTNSPSYSPVSNSSYSPYYFHHSTTTSTSPFPIRCQCLLCVEASTSGGDDSNRSSNYCQTDEGECDIMLKSPSKRLRFSN
ncbi:15900_t:CDS:2, partial [Entrophospora sp. SA101]